MYLLSSSMSNQAKGKRAAEEETPYIHLLYSLRPLSGIPMFFGANCVMVRAFTEQNKAVSNEVTLSWHPNGGLGGLSTLQFWNMQGEGSSITSRDAFLLLAETLIVTVSDSCRWFCWVGIYVRQTCRTEPSVCKRK